jgi:hypothetical protein
VQVKLNKGGFLTKQIWNEKKEKYEEFLTDKIIRNLSSIVELEEGVIFLDFIKFLENNLRFFQEFTGCDLTDFIEEVDVESVENLDNEIKKLEFYWYSDTYDNMLELCSSFHGIGEDRFALNLTSLNSIKNISLVLNKKVIIYDDEYNELVSYNREFTLLDLIDAVCDEVFYFGSILQRNKELNKLNETIENIKSGNEYFENFIDVEKD